MMLKNRLLSVKNFLSMAFIGCLGNLRRKIQFFLKLSGNLGQIMNLNIHEKKIGFLPIEVYKNDPKAYGEILNSCISAEETLNIIKEELL